MAEIAPGQRVLDLATGTGVVARAATARGARVCGGDLSTGMLARARRHDPEGTWVRLDAEGLPWATGRFDAVLCLFGLLHFPAPERALAEARRVLRPGGVLAVAVGSGPSRLTPAGWLDGLRRLRALAERTMGRRLEAPRHLDAVVERLLPRGAEPAESTLARDHHNRAAVVPRLLRDAGFRDLRTDWRGYEAPVHSVEDFLDLQATFSSRARKRLAAAGETERGQALEQARRECEAVLARGGRLVYPYAAFFAAGRTAGESAG
jgi:SAM-dependent methyltransferase